MSDFPSDPVVPPVLPTPAAVPLSYATQGLSAVPPGWHEVEIVALKPAAMMPFIWLQVGVVIAVVAVATALVTAVRLLIYGPWSAHAFMMDFATRTPWGAVLIVVMCVLYIRRTLKQWRRHRVAIAREGIVEHDSNGRVTIVEREMVRAVVERYDVFEVRLKSGRYLNVPKRVVDVDRVRARLGEVCSVTKPSAASARTWLQAVFVLLLSFAAVGLGVYGANVRATNAAAACTVAAFIIAIVLAFRVWRSMSLTTANRWYLMVIAFVPAVMTGLHLLRLLMAR